MNEAYDWTPDLWEGEEVLWQGRPDQSAYVFSWNDLILCLFIAKAFDWAIKDKSTSTVPLPEALNVYLVLFSVFMTCFLIWKRLIVDRRARSREIYAITNERAICANMHTHRVDRSIQFSSDLNVFEAGLSYRCVVFTKKRRILWLLSQATSQGMLIDGPPGLLGSHSDASLCFLATKDADTVMAIVAARFG